MINFKQYITEARSAPIYHGTTFVRALDIINQNRLINKTGEINRLKMNPKSRSGPTEHYLSFTRSLNFAKKYVDAYYNFPYVVFQVDQLKIAQRYKIKPYQFWFRKNARMLEKIGSSISLYSSNEYEERVFAKEIDNFMNYVTKIYISNHFDPTSFKQSIPSQYHHLVEVK